MVYTGKQGFVVMGYIFVEYKTAGLPFIPLATWRLVWYPVTILLKGVENGL
jgi:hypothetical protein